MGSRTDPGRPVFWATLGCRVIGGLTLLLDAYLLALSARSGLGLSEALVMCVLLAIGLAWFVLAQRLAGGRAWAGICGIVVACLTLLLDVALIAVEAIIMIDFLGGEVTDGLAVAIAIEALVAVALIWLVWQLWRSVRAIQRARAEVGHGFAVLPVAIQHAGVSPETINGDATR